MQMNSPKNEKGGSESEVISALKAEIHDFMLQKDRCVARIKELLFTENPSAGIIFSKEIFTLQQDKLRLQVEVDCRRNKINRIRMFGQSEELDQTK